VIDAGDIYLADLGLELRRPVVVLSSSAVIRATGRAVVAPAVLQDPGYDVPSPWRIGGFAIDAMATVREHRLLDQTGRVDAGSLRRMLKAARLFF
jgi:mRNA-degrading endonuclease toxin of MazEF toxin-antitoxin module